MREEPGRNARKREQSLADRASQVASARRHWRATEVTEDPLAADQAFDPGLKLGLAKITISVLTVASVRCPLLQFLEISGLAILLRYQSFDPRHSRYVSLVLSS
jgi:hypothetical protein